MHSFDGFFDSTCSSRKASTSSNQLPQCPNVPDCGFQKPHSLVLLSCLECFISEGSLCRFKYGVSPAAFLVKLRGGTCTTAESEAPDIVIHRAMYLLHSGFGQYDVFKNNCEDFALYCKTGLLIPGHGAPGSSGQVSGVFGATLAAVYSSLMANPICMVATGASLYCLSRFCNDIGVNSASIKVEVEDMVEELKEFAKVNNRLKRSTSLDEAETPLKRQKS